MQLAQLPAGSAVAASFRVLQQAMSGGAHENDAADWAEDLGRAQVELRKAEVSFAADAGAVPEQEAPPPAPERPRTRAAGLQGTA